jgi:hypothetical protein
MERESAVSGGEWRHDGDREAGEKMRQIDSRDDE